MIRTSPFHERTSAANETGLWAHWSGYLVAAKYQISEKFEYFAIRNSAGLFDSSPLFKYRIHGPDAERFLSGVLARDIRACPVGHGQYTIWCDERGYVVEDGVVLRHAADDYLLTVGRTELRLLRRRWSAATGSRSRTSREQFGVLAVQGPRSRAILAGLDPRVAKLDVLRADEGQDRRRAGDRLADRLHGRSRLRDLDRPPTTQSPSGMRSSRRRQGRGVIPFGLTALSMARIEAGLLLLDVDFQSSRFAWTDAHRSTPIELGLGWMFKDLADRRPGVHRPRGDRPRDRRQDVPLEAHRPRPRLARIRPAFRRGRAHPAEGPHADRGRVLHLRRRPQAAGLRDEPHVLADAPAPHRPRPRAARPRPRRARGSSSSSR